MDLEWAKRYLKTKPGVRDPLDQIEHRMIADDDMDLLIYGCNGGTRSIHFVNNPGNIEAIAFPLYSDTWSWDKPHDSACLTKILDSQGIRVLRWVKDDILFVPRTIEGIDLGYQAMVEYDKFLANLKMDKSHL